MNVIDRWRQVQNLLDKSDFITVEEFTKELNVSEATVRRDLSAMESMQIYIFWK